MLSLLKVRHMHAQPLLLIVLLLAIFTSGCKKEKSGEDGGGLVGLWVESSLKRDTVLVTAGEKGGVAGPMLLLYPDKRLAIPFAFQLNNAGDSITLSDLTASATDRYNVTYQIKVGEKAFEINKFHPSLPEGSPLLFNRVR